MIGCDLIRDLKLFNIPQDYFDELNNQFGIVRIDPENLPSNEVLNEIEEFENEYSRNDATSTAHEKQD